MQLNCRIQPFLNCCDMIVRGAEDGERGAEENGEWSLVVKLALLTPGIKIRLG